MKRQGSCPSIATNRFIESEIQSLQMKKKQIKCLLKNQPIRQKQIQVFQKQIHQNEQKIRKIQFQMQQIQLKIELKLQENTKYQTNLYQLRLNRETLIAQVEKNYNQLKKISDFNSCSQSGYLNLKIQEQFNKNQQVKNTYLSLIDQEYQINCYILKQFSVQNQNNKSILSFTSLLVKFFAQKLQINLNDNNQNWNIWRELRKKRKRQWVKILKKGQAETIQKQIFQSRESRMSQLVNNRWCPLINDQIFHINQNKFRKSCKRQNGHQIDQKCYRHNQDVLKEFELLRQDNSSYQLSERLFKVNSSSLKEQNRKISQNFLLPIYLILNQKKISQFKQFIIQKLSDQPFSFVQYTQKIITFFQLLQKLTINQEKYQNQPKQMQFLQYESKLEYLSSLKRSIRVTINSCNKISHKSQNLNFQIQLLKQYLKKLQQSSDLLLQKKQKAEKYLSSISKKYQIFQEIKKKDMHSIEKAIEYFRGKKDKKNQLQKQEKITESLQEIAYPQMILPRQESQICETIIRSNQLSLQQPKNYPCRKADVLKVSNNIKSQRNKVTLQRHDQNTKIAKISSQKQIKSNKEIKSTTTMNSPKMFI